MGITQRLLVPELVSRSVQRAVELVAGNGREIDGMQDRARLRQAVDWLLAERRWLLSEPGHIP